MYLHMRLNTQPVRVRTADRFFAPNPWDAHNPTLPAEWSVEVYAIVNVDLVHQFVSNLGRKAHAGSAKTKNSRTNLAGMQTLGIRSDADGRYHLLPQALAEMWQRGEVESAQLPHLLRSVEQNLTKRDFLVTRTNTALKFLLAFFILGALGMVAAYLFLEAPTNHTFRNQTAAEWLAQPMNQEQAIYVTNNVPLTGTTPVPFALAPPPGVNSYDQMQGGGSHYVAAWAPSSEGHRLIILRASELRNAASATQKPNELFYLMGSALKTDSVEGLAPFVAQLKSERVPDLNDGFVMFNGWRWDDAGGSPGLGVWWLYLAALWLLVPLGILAFRGIQTLKRRQLQNNLRENLRKV